MKFKNVKSKLIIMMAYFVVLLLIYPFSKGYLIVFLIVSMNAAWMMAVPLASLSYNISQGQHGESKFYAIVTFSVNSFMSCLVIALGVFDLDVIDTAIMLFFLLAGCAVTSYAAHHHFEWVFDYKNKNP